MRGEIGPVGSWGFLGMGSDLSVVAIHELPLENNKPCNTDTIHELRLRGDGSHSEKYIEQDGSINGTRM